MVSREQESGRPPSSGEIVAERISVNEATARMGLKNPQHLHLGLQQGRYPFGTAVKNPGGRWSYYINARRFEVYMSGEDMGTPETTKREGGVKTDGSERAREG